MSMKKIFFILKCLLIFTLTQTGINMAQAQKFHILPNGLEIVLEQDQRFPLVSLRLYVRTGSSSEKPGEEGISHFLEHMVFKGSDKRRPGQAAAEIEKAGGYLNAATSFDYTVYTIELPADQWRLGIDVLQDMVFGSTFDQDEISREKLVVLSEIDRSLDEPGRLVFRGIQSLIFQDTVYSHPILGFKETVEDFTRDQIINYHARTYQPGNMVLAIAGDIDPELVLQETMDAFQDSLNSWTITLPSPIEIPVSSDPDPADRVVLSKGPWSKAYFAAALPAAPIGSPDAAALDVLAYLLGGDSTSKLYNTFKYEKGLVNDISAGVFSLQRTGLLYFSVQLAHDNLQSFHQQFITHIASINPDDFTERQINRAIINLEERSHRAHETLGGKASDRGFTLLFERDPIAEQKYLRALKNVNRDELHRVVGHYLDPRLIFVSAVVPDSASITREILSKSLQDTQAATAQADLKAEPHDKTETIDLGKGRQLVLLHDHTLPHTSIHISWPGSSSLITRDMQGLPELTARTLTRETRQRSFQDIQQFLRDRASFVSASAGRTSFSVSARFPYTFSHDIVDLISDVILEPTFGQDELQRAVSDQQSAIKRQEDRPLGYAFRHLFPFLFSSGSYSYLQLGTEDFLSTASSDMTSNYWKKQRSMPYVISVCGKIDQDAVDRLIKNLKTIDTKPEQPTPDFLWSTDKIRDIQLVDRNQVHLLKVFPVPGRVDDHSPAVNVLNRVLAGQGGILFRELRDQEGLAYSVTSMLWQSNETGFIAFYIGTSPDKADKALDGFERVVHQLRKDYMDDLEVTRAANLLYGEYHRQRQTISSRANEASSLLVQGLDLDYNLEMTREVRNVSPEDLKMIAQTYLVPEKSYIMRVMP
ncbi:M16 family metallopeptidase [Desulfonatronovibrio magnus]|uniref:M16 family metallopeptidase n=1 Tax=Desulfonatronovibrio magnus TaxID=698827 RepID=UPI0006979694|nr:pitrilysin family protein [Desulfonatronovibrio magnus]